MEKEALLRKIKVLAERGVGGERESAKALFRQLMRKYGIEEADIIDEKIDTAWFRYRDEMECHLLKQIIYMVTNKKSFGCVGAASNRKRKERGIDCTKAEQIEIDMNYEFYKRAMKKELDVFFSAFCMKNELFPKEGETKDIHDLDAERRGRVMKATLMSAGMERHILNRMIEKN